VHLEDSRFKDYKLEMALSTQKCEFFYLLIKITKNLFYALCLPFIYEKFKKKKTVFEIYLSLEIVEESNFDYFSPKYEKNSNGLI